MKNKLHWTVKTTYFFFFPSQRLKKINIAILKNNNFDFFIFVQKYNF